MTIEDYCISLNPNNFFLVVLVVVDMCHDLLSKILVFPLVAYRIYETHLIQETLND